MGVPLALPHPSAICLFICPVWYLPTGLLRCGGWGPWSALAGPQPCAPFSSWLCLSCALQGSLVWAVPVLCQGGKGSFGGCTFRGPSAALPLVGSLNCSYGGVPALNFYIPRVWGFSYICTYRWCRSVRWPGGRVRCCGQAWWHLRGEGTGAALAPLLWRPPHPKGSPCPVVGLSPVGSHGARLRWESFPFLLSPSTIPRDP